MPTQILAIGTGAANSADVPVAAGTPLTVALKQAGGGTPRNTRVDILLKDDAGNYIRVDSLESPGTPAVVIVGPGTYRFSRAVDSDACGVFSG